MTPNCETSDPRNRVNAPGPLFVAESVAAGELVRLAARAAAGDARVLISGESGAGHDLLARDIHVQSPRSTHPFVAVNCAAFPGNELATELFGRSVEHPHTRYLNTRGKLHQADQGTVFLDGIAEMSLSVQAALVQFLDTGLVRKVSGDDPSVRSDVRVIASTSQDLGAIMASGEFRADLLYRIRMVHLRVPPLRARRADIYPLISQFASRSDRRFTFSAAARAAIERCQWPGNIWQLQNMVEQLTWMGPPEEIQLADLPPAIRSGGHDRGAMGERRRQIADELFDGLVSGSRSFWGHTCALLTRRDVTRHDLRQLVRRGLAATRGNYHELVNLFRMPSGDYAEFLRFLESQDCYVDARAYRCEKPAPPMLRPAPLGPASTLQRSAQSRGGRAGDA